MKREKIILLLSLIFMVMPFFINTYSIYKLLSICIGIILVDVYFVVIKKSKIFLLIYLPIILSTLLYSIDYLKIYALKLAPIFVIEKKVNDNVSIYNSLFYRMYKCNNDEYFDNNYEENFKCDTLLIKEIDINKLLNEPKESFKEYKNKFIKVTGKISKIKGTNSIEMQAYTTVEGQLNGYVKFNETSKLIVDLEGTDVSKYKIYDYITVVGLLNHYDNNKEILTITDIKLEEKDLYNDYAIHVIESAKCNHLPKEYITNYSLYCLENIYLDYKIDKYELSYALKDKKITMEEILKDTKLEEYENIKVYKHDKFNILSCSGDKNIIINRNEKVDYSLCEE